VALIGFVDFLNGLAVAPLLDLAELFTSIREEPEAYWWLYFTFFTTLIPTLLHLVLGLLSGILAFRLSKPVHWVRRWLPQVEEDAGAWMGSFLVLTTAGLLAIIIAYFALYGLVQLILRAHPTIGWSYIWVFEWYACWLGAPVTPGPFF